MFSLNVLHHFYIPHPRLSEQHNLNIVLDYPTSTTKILRTCLDKPKFWIIITPICHSNGKIYCVLFGRNVLKLCNLK